MNGRANTPRQVTLRFLAAPTDVAVLGGTAVAGGRVLEWIDKAAYACAAGWSGGYGVTAYVGNVNFTRPIQTGDMVEVLARLVHTGRSSMHIEVTVSSASPRELSNQLATSCTVIFVAVGADGRPVRAPQWVPIDDDDRRRQESAIDKIALRKDIENAMRDQRYTGDSTAPQITLRFLAAPTDVNWGGKTQGGTVMRWIDEAAFACAAGWSGASPIAVYSGGIRFYRPIAIGHLVEVDARLLYTGARSMHVSVHVRSGDPRTGEMQVTTHCLSVFVVLGADGRAAAVPTWHPERPEDRQLEAHALHLVELRKRLAPVYPM